MSGGRKAIGVTGVCIVRNI